MHFNTSIKDNVTCCVERAKMYIYCKLYTDIPSIVQGKQYISTILRNLLGWVLFLVCKNPIYEGVDFWHCRCHPKHSMPKQMSYQSAKNCLKAGYYPTLDTKYDVNVLKYEFMSTHLSHLITMHVRIWNKLSSNVLKRNPYIESGTYPSIFRTYYVCFVRTKYYLL